MFIFLKIFFSHMIILQMFITTNNIKLFTINYESKIPIITL